MGNLQDLLKEVDDILNSSDGLQTQIPLAQPEEQDDEILKVLTQCF